MKLFLLFSCASLASAFQVATKITPGSPFKFNVATTDYSESTRGSTSSDNSASATSPTTVYNPQQRTSSRFNRWKRVLDEAALTFAEHRELEAAGLLAEKEALEDVHRKAAAAFEVFAKNAQLELQAVNDNDKIYPTTAVSPPHAVQRALVHTAAVLGKTTGRVFGGALPENYRD